MIERLSGQIQSQKISSAVPRPAKTVSFEAALQREMQLAQEVRQPVREVAFSKHAISRAEERGIDITADLIDQLRGGMIRAQAKGATNILAMDTDKAFIINVPSAKVITAITQDEMKENIFTNIDGAVFL
ncbi:MAG: flagellar biosynthesis protein [Clostridiales bacterium]|nr:flagellar biosynthesis protein [Clostridiales bacterium]